MAEARQPVFVNVNSLQIAMKYLILDQRGRIIAGSFFDRSKNKVAGACCSLMTNGFYIRKGYRKENVSFGKDEKIEILYKRIRFGKDSIVAGSFFSRCGEIILTTEKYMQRDLYNRLMALSELPILPEYVPWLAGEMERQELLVKGQDVICSGSPDDYHLTLHGENVPLGQVRVMRILYDEAAFQSIFSEGLRSRKLVISEKPQKPISIDNLDDYMGLYGAEQVDRVYNEIKPLMPLKGNVEEFVSVKKRMYPQQAAVVNGMLALKKAKSRYGFATCGMGCGKTFMAEAVVEADANTQAMKEYRCGLKEVYKNGRSAYRAIVMCPGHLVEKWEREILAEIPGAKVAVIHSVSDLIPVRNAGKKAAGKEWYIISKDTSKLGTEDSPVPSKMVKDHVYLDYCADCYENKHILIYKKLVQNRFICPECRGRNFASRKATEYGMQEGMVCPDCGKILLNYASSAENPDDIGRRVLRPEDFASHTESNSKCYHCGNPLWAANIRPAGVSTPRPRKWVKISHYSNERCTSRKTAWVLMPEAKGQAAKMRHAMGYFRKAGLWDEGKGRLRNKMAVRFMDNSYGPRKFAPAVFIKKYLKGFFDYCILDEVHKYAGSGTAQGIAAQALVNASKFTLCLTGTLTNGKADSLFYLLWMLDPARMAGNGFSYKNPMEFTRQYGCVAQEFETGISEGGGVYNKTSRGKQIGSAKVQPGISPLLYTDFLLDKSINMDLSDFSGSMPKLEEKVELVAPPEDLLAAYNRTARELKNVLHKKEGTGILANILQFCLSYPDKPYGRKPIYAVRIPDLCIACPPNLTGYQDMLLPKERRLIEIIRGELQERRNVFVFATFTESAESNVLDRLKAVVEHNCNLNGRVEILRASTPEALKREAHLKARAKAGISVFICNPKLVETGMDFIWEEDGRLYNYPTIVFMQPTYELATMMQASRRSYRLNQVTECRVYWMAYERTLQAAALEIMAKKQVAASAIQGKFSAEGLSSMAKGTDTKVLLAQKLASGDNSDRETLSNMMDILAKGREDDGTYASFPKTLTYFELMGEEYMNNQIPAEAAGMNILELLSSGARRAAPAREKAALPADMPAERKAARETGGEPDWKAIFCFETRIFSSSAKSTAAPPRRRKRKEVCGQMALF